MDKAGQTQIRDDVRDSLAATAGSVATYGSLSENCPSKSKRRFLEKVERWGGTKAILLDLWLPLGEVIVCTMFISAARRYGDGMFVLDCQSLPNTFNRVICNVSCNMMLFFPGTCRLCFVSIVTFELLKEILFYVFFKHKMILVFDSRLDERLLKLLNAIPTVFFIGAAVHTAMNACLGTNRAGLDGGDPDLPLLQSTLGEVFSNPRELMEPKNKPLLLYVAYASAEFFMPAGWALRRSKEICYATTKLMPIGSICQSAPKYVHCHLGESIVVPEAVAREILQRDIQGAPESKTCKEIDIEDLALPEACEVVRNEALAFQSVRYMHRPAADMENATSAGRKEISLPPPSVWEFALKTWYPLNIVLKEEPDPNFSRPHAAWYIHMMIVFVLFAKDTIWKISGLYAGSKGRWAEIGLFGNGSAIAYTLCTFSFTSLNLWVCLTAFSQLCRRPVWKFMFRR